MLGPALPACQPSRRGSPALPSALPLPELGEARRSRWSSSWSASSRSRLEQLRRRRLENTPARLSYAACYWALVGLTTTCPSYPLCPHPWGAGLARPPFPQPRPPHPHPPHTPCPLPSSPYPLPPSPSFLDWMIRTAGFSCAPTHFPGSFIVGSQPVLGWKLT